MGLRKTAVQTTLLLVLATSISFAKGTLLQSHDWLARQVHVLAAEVSMALDAAPMHSASQVVPVLPACFVHRYNVIHRCCGVESLAFADRLDHGCQHRVVATSTILPAALTAGAFHTGKEDSLLQRRIERFLQESFQPGQGEFGAATGGSPPPGPPQSLTPIPRDSSLAKAVLTGEDP